VGVSVWEAESNTEKVSVLVGDQVTSRDKRAPAAIALGSTAAPLPVTVRPMVGFWFG
jgi:hypothetical protein